MKKERGLTLIEILISVVVLSTVVLSSIVFFSYGRKGAVKAKKVDYALQLAEDEMEILKTMSYDAVASSAYTTHQKYGTEFTRYYAASELYTYDEVYKVVTISVTWNADGITRDIELFSVISPKD